MTCSHCAILNGLVTCGLWGIPQGTILGPLLLNLIYLLEEFSTVCFMCTKLFVDVTLYH